MLTHDLATRTITFARALTARGFLGRLCQRGLLVQTLPDRRAVALRAYTDRGPSTAAQLEVPVDDLRRLARILLDLADHADHAKQDHGHLRLSPVTLAHLAA